MFDRDTIPCSASCYGGFDYCFLLLLPEKLALTLFKKDYLTLFFGLAGPFKIRLYVSGP